MEFAHFYGSQKIAVHIVQGKLYAFVVDYDVPLTVNSLHDSTFKDSSALLMTSQAVKEE